MSQKKLRIAFMGTPDFAVPALDALHKSGHEIICVYSQPPRPKGRGYEVTPSPVHAFALKNNIPVFHPKNLKNAEEQEIFKNHNLDLAVVSAYGLILPKQILDAPKHGCINIHASILPRWRGASPIQRSIWEGDPETGVTLMQMDEGLDTGAMIETRSIPIGPKTTASGLHDDLSVLGGAMIVAAVERLASEGKLNSKPQDNSKSTYAKLLKKEDGRVNWIQSAERIDRQIRALNPWPGVWTDLADKRFKILEAAPESGAHKNPGEIIDREGRVSCGSGVLKIITIQPPNGKPMDFAAAVNGGYLKAGDRFS